MVLIDQHIARLVEDGRSVRTLDTYCYDAAKLAKFIAGVRVGEASSVNRCRPEIHANRPRPHDGPAGTHPLTRSPSTRRAK
jgi:hypothetical protein